MSFIVIIKQNKLRSKGGKQVIGVKEIVQDGVKFILDDERHALIKMIKDRHIKEVFIPHELESGDKIDYLNHDFCQQGEYSKITIDEGIKVRRQAFYQADVSKVVWNLSNRIIPSECFNSSNIKEIENIDNVTRIDDNAFANSEIREFKWPTHCPIIPHHCFAGSPLCKISNISNVQEISFAAFIRTSPEFVLDLSETGSCMFQEGALEGLNADNIIFPYYTSEEEMKKAIG